MKILLAIDGSAHSKAAIEEVARKLFPLNTKVRIVSAYEKIPLITTEGSLGVGLLNAFCWARFLMQFHYMQNVLY